MKLAQRRRGLGAPQRPATWTETGFVSKRIHRPVQKRAEAANTLIATLQRYEEQLESHHVMLRLEAVERISTLLRSMEQRDMSIKSLPFTWLKLFDKIVILATEPSRARGREQAAQLVLQLLRLGGNDLDLSPVLRAVLLRIAGAAASPKVDSRMESFRLLCGMVAESSMKWRPVLMEILADDAMITTFIQAWIQWAGGDTAALLKEGATSEPSLSMQHRPHLAQGANLEACLDALDLLLEVAASRTKQHPSDPSDSLGGESPGNLATQSITMKGETGYGHGAPLDFVAQAVDPVVFRVHPGETPTVRLVRVPDSAPSLNLSLIRFVTETHRQAMTKNIPLLRGFYREAFRVMTSFVLEDGIWDSRLYGLLNQCVLLEQCSVARVSGAISSPVASSLTFVHWVYRIWARYLEPRWKNKPRTRETDRAFASLTITIAEALSRPDIISEEMVPAAVEEGLAWRLLSMSRFPSLVQQAWRQDWLRRCTLSTERSASSPPHLKRSDWPMLERYGDQDCLIGAVKLAYRFLLSARAADRGRMEQSIAAECLRLVRRVLQGPQVAFIEKDGCRSIMLVMAPFFAVPSRKLLVITELAPCLLMEIEALLERLLFLSGGRVPLRLERAMAACQEHEKVIRNGRWRSVLSLSQYMVLETRFLLLVALARGLSRLDISLETPQGTIDTERAVAGPSAQERQEAYTLLRREWMALSRPFPWLRYALYQLSECGTAHT
ncbi:hypothetical protein CCYA_CCYA14G3771 [Cyanidiococcus yangmingshanensis]|nr:hypothetical protein CCYA_CCYA14G3771 [Cyanidiococcus yangmingshanensis]